MDKRNPLSLLSELEEVSNNPDYKKEIKNYIFKLRKKKLPIIFNHEHLSKILKCESSYFYLIVTRKIETYKIFYIKKRTGGKRRIAVPQYVLSIIQSWIKTEILDKLSSHPCSMAYEKDCSIVNNASIHCNKKWLVKLDIENFFESISERKVYRIFRYCGYTKYISFLLTRLCTYPLELNKKNKSNRWSYFSKGLIMESNKFNKHGKPIIGSLVQGAKTSPQLSNLCFYEIDEEIDRLCINNDCTYSRYSDDIFISSNSLDRDRAIDMIRQIRKIISMKGFRINNKKTLICPPGTKKIVTGLVVNSKNPTAKIQYIKLKNYAYYIKKYDINDACKYSGFKSVIGYKNHIYGILSYIKQFDIKRYNEYKSAFDNFSWPKI